MKPIFTLVACATILAACRGKEESAGDVVSDSNTAAMPVTQAAWAPEALDELVAPIALYPDQLVGQILAASVNAQEVLDVGNWLLQNQNLKGAQLDAAAQKAGFGPATRALVPFPTVVDMMCQEIDWTRQLGTAFTSDQKAVLDAVQRLRTQAADVGNLASTPQQTVERKTEEGKQIIEVKPADPTVVYVPQYDPTVVYTTPPPPAPAPAPQENTVSTSSAVAGGLLAFGVGVLVGSALDNDDHYYPHWGTSAVYFGPRPFYPPAYVYRPVYGPAFRPAYRYVPPPGYRHSYNSGNTVIINNKNYYNRFENQQNVRVNQPRTTAGATRQAGAGNRPGQPATAGRGQNWKGQSTYAGARPGGAAATPAGRNASQRASQPAAAARSAKPSQTAARAASRPNASASASKRDRGYGSSSPSRPGPAAAAATPAAAAPSRSSNRAAAPNASSAQREHAFSGASQQGTGSFDRAASARGHASAPAKTSRERPARAGRKP